MNQPVAGSNSSDEFEDGSIERKVFGYVQHGPILQVVSENWNDTRLFEMIHEEMRQSAIVYGMIL
jgi:CobQ-like glutamine amidotransferase family enzyme